MYSGMNGEPIPTDNAQAAVNENVQAGVSNMQPETGAMNQAAAMDQAATMANPYYQGTAAQPQASYQQPGMMANPYYTQPLNNTAVPVQKSTTDLLIGTTTNERFIRGLVIGAAAAYLLTNESAQKAVIKTGMKVYGAIAGGVEEFKEKVMDAKAELDEEATAQEQEGA